MDLMISVRTIPCQNEPKRCSNIPAEHIPIKDSGVRYSVVPPTNAISISLFNNACIPRCVATNEEEHAVSIVIAGPLRFR